MSDQGESKEWACEVPGGTSFRLADLPIDAVGEIAREAGLGWFYAIQAPQLDDRVMVGLYRYCCERAGATVPDPLTGRILESAFTQVEDDLPTVFADGLPKEVAEATTVSSSEPSTTSA